MLLHSHPRRRPYSSAEPRQNGTTLRRVASLVILALVLYLVGSWVLRLFGTDSNLRRAAALAVESGTVQVSVEGGEPQRAQNGMKLYAGDVLTTQGNGRASVRFFDRSFVRADYRTELAITESALSTQTSALALQLKKGTVWIGIPGMDLFSGSILRTIETPFATLTVPAGTEALVTERGIKVFAASGEGIRVQVKGDGAITVGVGQQFELPTANVQSDDLYAYRSALDPSASRMPFVEESHRKWREFLASLGAQSAPPPAQPDMSISSPEDGATVRGASVNVIGSISDHIAEVHVNGQAATVNPTERSFSYALALPAGSGEVTITVEGLDRDGIVLERIELKVKHEAEQPTVGAPTITSPGKAGETVKTSQQEFILQGGAPAGTTQIYVNDYRLQLFKPGDKEWKYLASVALGNLKVGTNVFDVTAVDGAGRRGPAARITVVVDTSTSPPPPPPPPSELPQNEPLLPGTLSVTAPTAGTTHTETGTGFLLEGATSPETAAIYVNEYRLQLYKAGKTTWNYKAGVDLGNLKRGTNTYRIVARNTANQILDAMTYTVEFKPQ
jgi:hypothetical protein